MRLSDHDIRAHFAGMFRHLTLAQRSALWPDYVDRIEREGIVDATQAARLKQAGP